MRVENTPSEASGVLLKAENAPGEAMPCDVSCPERSETKKTRSLYPPPYVGEVYRPLEMPKTV